MELWSVLTKKKLFERVRIEPIERRITDRCAVTIPEASVVTEANRIQSETLHYPMDAMILAAAGAIGAYRLVDQGVLDYEKPVADYWPEFAPADREPIANLGGGGAHGRRGDSSKGRLPARVTSCLGDESPAWTLPRTRLSTRMMGRVQWSIELRNYRYSPDRRRAPQSFPSV